jgi:hypothetical protein
VIELEALRKDVFGFDYKTDRHGNPIQQGIGAPGRKRPTICKVSGAMRVRKATSVRFGDFGKRIRPEQRL